MPDKQLYQSASNKPIWYFLLFWTLLNAIQAYTLELHGDEAYYWMYSRFLDWGYFDHPPMVAIFIRIGDSLMHNELGLRLLTVITNSASIYLLWIILKKYAVEARWFILVVSGMFIFHVYGFTTTPDSPLLFFTVLFYFFYQRYLNEDKWYLALILGFVIAGLLYSKYHGILLVGFTLCSNIKLLRRKSFLGIVVLALILFSQHISWQVDHDYPSLKYHLVDRSADHYSPDFTLTYPLGQLAMAGPLIGWFLFYSASKIKIRDSFIRALAVNAVGTFLFFLINTYKGEVQPHWTLIAFVPLLMLVLIRFKQSQAPPSWFYKLTIVNLVIILFIRAALLFQFPFVMKIGQFKSYFGFRDWAAHVKQRAGDNYVIIRDGFQDPSKYNYYTNSLKAMSYDSRYYRKTEYDMWPFEDSLQHKKVYYMADGPVLGTTTDSIIEPYDRKWYGGWVNDTRTYQKVDILVLGLQKPIPNLEHKNLRHNLITTKIGKGINAMPGGALQFRLLLEYPYDQLDFTNVGKTHPVYLEACFFQGENMILSERAGDDFNLIKMNSVNESTYVFKVKAPEKKGKYELTFSIRTTPFPGSKNSSAISFIVE